MSLIRIQTWTVRANTRRTHPQPHQSAHGGYEFDLLRQHHRNSFMMVCFGNLPHFNRQGLLMDSSRTH